MRRDEDDLIGDVPASDIGETLSFRTADVHLIGGGVTIPWLMKAFRMGRATVEKKLVGCAPIGQGKHSTPIYDLPEAASYLVKPRVELNRMLRDLKPEDLPERLREGYWNSKLKQQRFEERAGNLWRTERVLETFSETLQEIRTKLMIVPDRVDREVGLTPEQVSAVATVIDEVQDDIHQFIVGLSRRRATPNQLGEDRAGGDEEDEDII